MARPPAEPALAAPGSTAAYAERLGVPWWWWLSALALAALLAAEVWLGGNGLRAWLPFAVVLPLMVGALGWLGRVRVAVVDDELRVDDARLPTRFVADAVALDADGRREVLGVGADPLAFVVQRPWVAGAVQVVLDDPADPTPYWVVSSRHPVELATALLAARTAHRPPPAPRTDPPPADPTRPYPPPADPPPALPDPGRPDPALPDPGQPGGDDRSPPQR